MKYIKIGNNLEISDLSNLGSNILRHEIEDFDINEIKNVTINYVDPKIAFKFVNDNNHFFKNCDFITFKSRDLTKTIDVKSLIEKNKEYGFDDSRWLGTDLYIEIFLKDYKDFFHTALPTGSVEDIISFEDIIKNKNLFIDKENNSSLYNNDVSKLTNVKLPEEILEVLSKNLEPKYFNKLVNLERSEALDFFKTVLQSFGKVSYVKNAVIKGTNNYFTKDIFTNSIKHYFDDKSLNSTSLNTINKLESALNGIDVKYHIDENDYIHIDEITMEDTNENFEKIFSLKDFYDIKTDDIKILNITDGDNKTTKIENLSRDFKNLNNALAYYYVTKNYPEIPCNNYFIKAANHIFSFKDLNLINTELTNLSETSLYLSERSDIECMHFDKYLEDCKNAFYEKLKNTPDAKTCPDITKSFALFGQRFNIDPSDLIKNIDIKEVKSLLDKNFSYMDTVISTAILEKEELKKIENVKDLNEKMQLIVNKWERDENLNPDMLSWCVNHPNINVNIFKLVLENFNELEIKKDTRLSDALNKILVKALDYDDKELADFIRNSITAFNKENKAVQEKETGNEYIVETDELLI